MNFNLIYTDNIITNLQFNEDNWCLKNGYFLKLIYNTEDFIIFNIENLNLSQFSINSTLKVTKYQLFTDLDNRKFIYIINYSPVSYNLVDFNYSSSAGIIITGLLIKKSKLIKLRSFLVFSLTIKSYNFTKIVFVKDWKLYGLNIGTRYKLKSCLLLFDNVFELASSKVESLDGENDIVLECKTTELTVQCVLDLDLGLIKCEDDCYLIIDSKVDLINWTLGSGTKILLFDSVPIKLNTDQNEVKLFNIDLFTNYKIINLVLDGYKKPNYYLDHPYQSDSQWVYNIWLLKIKLLKNNLIDTFLAIMDFCGIRYFQFKPSLVAEDLIPKYSTKDTVNILLTLNTNTITSSNNQFVLLKLVLNSNLNGLDWLDSSTRTPAKVKFKGTPIVNNLKVWVNHWYVVPSHLFNHPTIELKECLKLDINDILLLNSLRIEDLKIDHSFEIESSDSSALSINFHLNTPGPVEDSNIVHRYNPEEKRRLRDNSNTLSFQILNQYPTTYTTIIQCISLTKLNIFYLVLTKYQSTLFDLANSKYFQLTNFEVVYNNYLKINHNSIIQSTCSQLITFDNIVGRIINLTWSSHHLIAYENSKIFTTNFNLTVETLDLSTIELNCSYLLLQRIIKFEDLRQLNMYRVKLKDFYFEFNTIKSDIAHIKPLKSITTCYKLLELIGNI